MRNYQATRDARERLEADGPELDEKKQMNLKGLPLRVRDEILDFASKEGISNGAFVASTVTLWKLVGQPSHKDIEAMWKGEKPAPKVADGKAVVTRPRSPESATTSAGVIDDLMRLTQIAQDAELLPDGRTKSAIRKKTQLILTQIGPEEAAPLPVPRKSKPRLITADPPEATGTDG